MLVKDIMSRKPVCAEVTSSIRQAIYTLQDLDIRHLPVTDNGRFVGIVSDRDVRSVFPSLEERLEHPHRSTQKLDAPVSEIMQADPETLSNDAHVSEAIDLIVEHKIGAVPVVDEHSGKLVGIVSYIDILLAAREALDAA